MGHVYQNLSVLPADAVFILAATAFISSGSTFGTQRYGVFPQYPGTVIPKFIEHLHYQSCHNSWTVPWFVIGHQMHV